MHRKTNITYTAHAILSMVANVTPAIYIVIMWIFQKKGVFTEHHIENGNMFTLIISVLSLISLISGFILKKFALNKAENEPDPKNIRVLPSRMLIAAGLIQTPAVFSFLLFILKLIDFKIAAGICIAVTFLSFSCKITREDWERLGIDDAMQQ